MDSMVKHVRGQEYPRWHYPTPPDLIGNSWKSHFCNTRSRGELLLATGDRSVTCGKCQKYIPFYIRKAVEAFGQERLERERDRDS